MKKTDFYTKTKSKAGIKMPLALPDGSDSGEWLTVHGPDCEEYDRALQGFRQAYALADAMQDATQKEAAMAQLMLEYRCALVCGWSFAEPCTREALVELLANAPAIAMHIEALAGDRRHFFGLDSMSSLLGQPQSTPSPAAIGEPLPSEPARF